MTKNPLTFVLIVLLIGLGVVVLLTKLTEPSAPTPTEAAKMKEIAQQIETLHRGDLIEYSDGAIVRVCITPYGNEIRLQRTFNINDCMTPLLIKYAAYGVVGIYRYGEPEWTRAAGKFLHVENLNSNP